MKAIHLSLAIVLTLTLNAFALEGSYPPPPPPTQVVNAPQATQLTPPRMRVAIFDFENKVRSAYGSWDIGEGMTEMLMTALSSVSHRVQILDRAAMHELVEEKNIQAASGGGDMNKKTILGAQYYIKGAVTEFSQSTSGGGGGLKIKGISFGMQSANAHVAIDLRIVDAGTGEVISSKRIEQKINRRKFNAGADIKGISFGGNKFNESPVGEATRQCIAQATAFVLNDMSEKKWSSVVVMTKNENKIIIRGGTNSGIAPLMRFQVFSKGEELIDPETGEDLGSETEAGGIIEITSVKEKISIARLVGGPLPARSDIVEYLK